MDDVAVVADGSGVLHTPALLLLHVHITVRMGESLATVLTRCERSRRPSSATSLPASGGRQHVAVALFGALHYVFAILTPFCPLRLSDVGLLLGVASPKWPVVAGPALVIAGVGVFVWAQYHQWQCHRILARLRATGYGIPTGGWFEGLTMPHYWAEVLIYVSVVLVQPRHALCGWLMMVWVASNLSISATRSHEWYQHTFGPTFARLNRRIIVPWLY